MSDREAHIRDFLHTSGWASATRVPLAGDASRRRYFRLTNGPGGLPAILMDAPPAQGESVLRFLAVSRILSDLGLAPPEIISADPDTGLILLEDLGDTLFAQHLKHHPTDEKRLYLSATDVLAVLHGAAPQELPPYGRDEMATMAGLAPDWYGRATSAAPNPENRTAIAGAFLKAFDALPTQRPVLTLRDYHAENLFWLPARKAPRNVGLIDFQDAALGHPVYDLVSLGIDARRDVSPETRAAMETRFAAETDIPLDVLAASCATISAQRNLRILGVFARLSLHFGKPQYIGLIPRVWANLAQDLEHPALQDLRRTVTELLPPPNANTLDSLRRQCATIPTL